MIFELKRRSLKMDILFKECFENIPFGDKDDNGKQNKELTKILFQP